MAARAHLFKEGLAGCSPSLVNWADDRDKFLSLSDAVLLHSVVLSTHPTLNPPHLAISHLVFPPVTESRNCPTQPWVVCAAASIL